ncbi:MAG: tRNA (adenosine(37)-N6)-threonylcarbamoyltransferase complex transferase subunit TsaD [Nitrospinota bacterium]|nr:tRNA (adenosine(37)-N6)-threonylcarbamoyltransferase complex transferase subunit TsaD [Nitrospinota bacterium]
MIVLGIETSCDETACSVVDFEKAVQFPGNGQAPVIISNIINSQSKLHSRYGGVVPDLASRIHVEVIEPVVRKALNEADVSLKDVDLVSVTRGPGLAVSLLVGVSIAKSIAWGRGLPLIGVNHLEGHIYSLFLDSAIEKDKSSFNQVGGVPSFPHLSLIVSGGHSDFYRVEEGGEISHLGGTLDDSVGEVFDKISVAMGIGYPGGPAIDKLYREFKNNNLSTSISFPRPFLKNKLYDLSFSGLKTAVLSHLKELGVYDYTSKIPPWERKIKISDEISREIAASFQEAAVDVLVTKSKLILEHENLRTITICGGVASNSLLREKFQDMEIQDGISVHFPSLRLCMDNAAMIACAGGYKFLREEDENFWEFSSMDVDPRWQI